MLDRRSKLLPLLAVIVLCGSSGNLQPPRASAQQKPRPQATSNAGEAPEVATRFSGMVQAKNPKGTAISLKVEVKEWTVTRSAQAFEMPDQGFYIVHLISGHISTEIAGKTTERHSGDFWVVEKGQHMAISLQRPQESVGLQTVALSPGH